MSVPTDVRATRSERLDRLPFTREHRKLVVGSGLGWALDAMDVGLISFVMAALAKQWGVGTGTLSWIASVGFIGMAIGASVGGLLADRIGRRQVFALTLLVYGTATGLSALSWSVASLMAFRFLVGLGLGAFVDRRWLLLPAAVAAILLQHAVQGWCPPVPVMRRLGIRTQAEIQEEIDALRVLRGDFRPARDAGEAVAQVVGATH